MLNRIPELYIAPSTGRGRGVFTAVTIPAGSLIEICPVIILPPADLARIHETHLHDYYFLWGNEGAGAIALGFGSLYNHARVANADYEMQFEDLAIQILSTKEIAAGNEITINYTDGDTFRTNLWFEEYAT